MEICRSFRLIGEVDSDEKVEEHCKIAPADRHAHREQNRRFNDSVARRKWRFMASLFSKQIITHKKYNEHFDVTFICST